MRSKVTLTINYAPFSSFSDSSKFIMNSDEALLERRLELMRNPTEQCVDEFKELSESSAFSAENYTNTTTDISNPMSTKSLGNERSDLEFSFASVDASKKTPSVSSLQVPMKKKKSVSCHDLQPSKKNYDHIESKVKKMIRSMTDARTEADNRRKLLRHKSMPISPQLPMDETFNETSEMGDLIKELRKKAVKIYELEEECEEKDSRIYSLEYERSKMKMTFDKVR